VGKNNNFSRIRFLLFILIIFCILLQVMPCSSFAKYSKTFQMSEIVICAETDYKTKAFVYSAEQEGPSIMIMAGVHGDELAGMKAVERFMGNIELKRGTVIIIPEANKKAVEHGVRALSAAEDLNRHYPGDISSAEEIKVLAGEIFNIMNNNEVDFLLDLHESADYYHRNKNFYGQTIVLDDNKDPFLNEIANYLADELNEIIISSKNMFNVIVKSIAGSSTHEALNHLDISGITFETCKKIDYKKRVDLHYQCIEKVLAYFDVIDVQFESISGK